MLRILSLLEIMLCFQCICAVVAWTIEMMVQFKFKFNLYCALFFLRRGKKNCQRCKSFRRSTMWAFHSSSCFIIVMSLRLSIRLEYQLCIQLEFLLCQYSNFLLDFCAQTLALMPRHSSVAWRPPLALQPKQPPAAVSDGCCHRTTDRCASPSKVAGHHSDGWRRQPPLRPTGLHNPHPAAAEEGVTVV
jgi:hypothetical protein